MEEMIIELKVISESLVAYIYTLADGEPTIESLESFFENNNDARVALNMLAELDVALDRKYCDEVLDYVYNKSDESCHM